MNLTSYYMYKTLNDKNPLSTFQVSGHLDVIQNYKSCLNINGETYHVHMYEVVVSRVVNSLQ